MKRSWYKRPDGFDNFPAMSPAPCGLSSDNALGPSEVDLVETEVGMFRTDMICSFFVRQITDRINITIYRLCLRITIIHILISGACDLHFEILRKKVRVKHDLLIIG